MPSTASSWSCELPVLRHSAPRSSGVLPSFAAPRSSPPRLQSRDAELTRWFAYRGWVAPPVAVLVRFGIGWDLYVGRTTAFGPAPRPPPPAEFLMTLPFPFRILNIILTLCGYIPGHAHK